MESGRRDLDNGEVNGSLKEASVATYKSLPDDDLNWQDKGSDNATMVKPSDNEADDGAHERMLKDDGKISTNKEATEVKFISENGDAKIDIETVKKTFSGMDKEELMKFANDPFWIRLRWFLFIAFWLLWVAMLAGAVAIIIMAPKCSAPQPKIWWEESPIVQLEVGDSPSKDLKGLQSLLDTLETHHIKAISLSSIVKQSAAGHTEDFKDIQPQIGRINDLENLINAAKAKNQHIILELDPNHSSIEHPWFKRSVEKEDPYTSYYVWSDGKISADGKPNPPNNWLSVNGGSAWEWNEKRGQYYLHQFNKTQPDLNFRNPSVIIEFKEIFMHWLKLGITGFRLANTQYLMESEALQDESRSAGPADLDDYQSLVHVHTKNLPENADILRSWKEVVANHTKGEGLFALTDDIGADILSVFNEKKSLIDIPQNSQFLANADQNITAVTLNQSISNWLAISSWPGWDVNGKQKNLRRRMPSDIADSLTLMTLLLPGTPILKLNDTLLPNEAFVTLSKARKGLVFLHGETQTMVVNGTVFVYTRLKSGNPGYLVAYQSSEQFATINLSSLPQVPEEVNLLTYSPNYVQNNNIIQTKLRSNSVPISPKSTLVLSFVPNKS